MLTTTQLSSKALVGGGWSCIGSCATAAGTAASAAGRVGAATAAVSVGGVGVASTGVGGVGGLTSDEAGNLLPRLGLA